jgi:hypothetical protein
MELSAAVEEAIRDGHGLDDVLEWELDFDLSQKITPVDLFETSHEEIADESDDENILRGPQDLDEEKASPPREHDRPKRRASHPGSDGVPKKRRRRYRRASLRMGHKKAAGIPKRTLSAYNLFFQKERPKIFAEFKSRIGFEKLGKIVGSRWRNLSSEDRKKYEEEAAKDGIRYRTEMEAFDDSRRKRFSDPKVKVTESPRSPIDSFCELYSSPGCYKDAKAIPVYRARTTQARVGVFSTQPFNQDSIFNWPPGYICGNQIYPSYMPSWPPASYNARSTQPYYPHPLSYDHSPRVYHHDLRDCNSSPYTYTSAPILPDCRTPPAPDLTRADPENCITPDRERRVALRIAPCPSLSPESVLPPGMEIVLPDEYGQGRRYKVSYNCFRMTQEEADAYVKLAGHAKQIRPLSVVDKSSHY